MKKLYTFIIIIFVIIISIIIVFHTQNNNENSYSMSGGLIGEIVEIYDDSYRVIVIENDSHFSKGDNVLVKYDTNYNYIYVIGDNIDIVYSKYIKNNDEYVIYSYSISKIDNDFLN